MVVWTSGKAARLLPIILILCWCLPEGVGANGFQLNIVDAQRIEDVYYLDAEVDYVLSADVREALFNGVPLEFELEAEVIRLRRWLWNETVLATSRRYLLRYRVLAKHYQVVDLSSGEKAYFKTLSRALQTLGQVKRWPIIQVDQLVHKELYQIKVRCRLDVDALPLPLQPTSLFSSAWKLASDWSVWRLNY